MTQPDERRAVLTRTRNLKMSRSAHAYVRGSTLRFYQWLEESSERLPQGPSVWICGDCHVGNLGPLADASGKVAVQIRDLDQTVIGNPAHDLVRLGLSLASAARGSDLPGVVTARMMEALIEGYVAALADDFAGGSDHVHRPKPIKLLLRQAMRRRWTHLARERLSDVRPTLPLGKRFWPMSPEEHLALKDLFSGEPAHALVTSLKARDDDAEVELVDAAYWMKGCSSLGRLRYAALLRVGSGDGASLCLVDLKEAVTAAAPRAPHARMPRGNAMRVVAGAKALSPHLGGRMLATRLLDRPMVLRELMPQDLKIEIHQLAEDRAMEVARYLAAVVGRAHARQMGLSERQAWRSDLTRSHTATLDAPSWLWSSVVELLGLHEAAYLDHCRRYALAQAA